MKHPMFIAITKRSNIRHEWRRCSCSLSIFVYKSCCEKFTCIVGYLIYQWDIWSWLQSQKDPIRDRNKVVAARHLYSWISQVFCVIYKHYWFVLNLPQIYVYIVGFASFSIHIAGTYILTLYQQGLEYANCISYIGVRSHFHQKKRDVLCMTVNFIWC